MAKRKCGTKAKAKKRKYTKRRKSTAKKSTTKRKSKSGSLVGTTTGTVRKVGKEALDGDLLGVLSAITGPIRKIGSKTLKTIGV